MFVLFIAFLPIARTLSLSLSLPRSSSLSVCLSHFCIFTFISLSISLSLHLSIVHFAHSFSVSCLSLYSLFVFPSVCLYVYLPRSPDHSLPLPLPPLAALGAFFGAVLVAKLRFIANFVRQNLPTRKYFFVPLL